MKTKGQHRHPLTRMIYAIPCTIVLCFVVLFFVILLGEYKDFMWPLTALFFAIIATFFVILPFYFLIERFFRKYSKGRKTIFFSIFCFSFSSVLTLTLRLLKYGNLDGAIHAVIYGMCFFSLPLIAGYLGFQYVFKE